ncbi:ABC transporter substrate-binding protein [Maritimibacter sp. UBA3975]|uniref:ABC transporter substrate-binding protein n=1 Tax=Maritimibacter sp. UBA3975 TaxID=1946833 RepID=UPI000C097CE8|nr:ABC transporter substrate-binding protein [Maritimibacter sp. UBA3975]MAM61529.1 ABC transporter substrate-binding protein [Maritimibacter sp.]|tara:strand:+ start:9666 stop:10676 length:1011 start_codon:yes stop_codon:yes gene_type:complete
MKTKTLSVLGALGLSVSFAGAAMAQECGDVSIAEMDWASAELMANVDAIILEEGYGCDVSLIPGATTTTFASMSEKAEPDVAPELWINAVRDPLTAAKEEGSLVALNDGPITGLGEGWWVTPAFAEEYPELDTVEKLLERPDLFPYAEDKSKGAFIGCPAGWGCQLVNANLFRAFDMEEKGWVLVDPGSAAGLDGSMAKAADRGENWFGYYWSPTSMIGKYDMVMLPFEVEFAGRENWDGCIALAEQDCQDPQPTAWTVSEVETVVTDDFMEKGGVAADYFESRVFPGDIMNQMLVFMNENQATGEDAAFEFLISHEDIWTSWVSEDVATKVKDAL